MNVLVKSHFMQHMPVFPQDDDFSDIMARLNPPPPEYPCRSCSMIFSNEIIFDEHMKNHGVEQEYRKFGNLSENKNDPDLYIPTNIS